MRVGPVQLVASSDNLAGALWLKNSQTTNLRLGLNLVFGQADTHVELPTNPFNSHE